MPRPTKHVYYSLTAKNPFLPPEYYESLLDDLDTKMAERMLEGKWIELGEEIIYYTYDTDVNFKKGQKFKIPDDLPIRVCWDFNIGEGKPLSVVLMCFDPERKHFDVFAEVIIHGIRTEAACEEMTNRGLLDYPNKYIIHGDATGKARHTSSLKTNYEIIEEFFANYKRPDGSSMDYEKQVPMSNPPIRTRHTKVRAYCKNAKGKVRLHVWGDCKILDKGLRLTKLKKGGQFVEDDTKEYQHCTTALGYGICTTLREHERGKTETTIL